MLSDDLKQALSERWNWHPPADIKGTVRTLGTQVTELGDDIEFMRKGVAADNHLNAKAGVVAALKSADKIRATLKRIA